MDNVSPRVRSKIMSRIRGKNTRPERAVRQALRRLGLFGYRIHVRALPGTPDIVFPRARVVVHVKGCFWHRHGCRPRKMPGTNRAYWERKFRVGAAQGLKNDAWLRRRGWSVLTVWECETLDAEALDRAARRIARRVAERT